MASQDEPLDELIWRNQDWAMHFGGIHENTVLYYFAKSPFFDPTSNNATVETQAMYNPDLISILETREAFENHLEKLNGLEYRVYLGPRDFGPEKAIGQGLWVIRKQNRRIIYAQGGGAAVDAQITVLATYFVVGESIYMARSVSNILSSRLLSATAALNKIFEKASSLSLFTPAFGHHYISPHLRSKKTQSAVQTRAQSREATPTADNASQFSGNLTKVATSNSGDFSTLLDAFNQFNAYGSEYMDENPLLGEPGSFVFSSSREHVLAQQEAAAKRAQQQADLKKAQEEARAKSRAQSPARDSPKPKKEPGTSKRPAKGEGRPGGKIKRRKTRGPGTPAVGTPMMGTPAADSPMVSTPVASPG